MSDSKPRKVFFSRQLPGVALDRLAAEADVTIWPKADAPTPDELSDVVRGCDAILTLLSDAVDGRVMDAAGPQLKVISNYAVGYNNIDLAAAKQRGIQVGNTPDVLTDATADLAATLMLAASRRVAEAADDVTSGRWQNWEPAGLLGVEPSGKTLGIIGMGRIGKALANRMVGGWKMNLIYTSRRDQTDVNESLSGRRVELDELLRESDFISIHVALCEATRKLIDAEAFAKMKSNVVLVNTARGEIIDQDALLDALDTCKIFTAGLDVTTPEPLPASHPLVQHQRCLILPHIGSATTTARSAMTEIAVDNIIAGIQGKSLRCPVTL
ncbi:2-hydroxyacid dehydrogenase [Rubripirellula obstinata]|nr:D-glycerate dehydrogenase [Rubripirellula obstinata]